MSQTHPDPLYHTSVAQKWILGLEGEFPLDSQPLLSDVIWMFCITPLPLDKVIITL